MKFKVVAVFLITFFFFALFSFSYVYNSLDLEWLRAFKWFNLILYMATKCYRPLTVQVLVLYPVTRSC